MLFLFLFVAAVVDASALVGEDSSGNLVLDSRPGQRVVANGVDLTGIDTNDAEHSRLIEAQGTVIAEQSTNLAAAQSTIEAQGETIDVLARRQETAAATMDRLIGQVLALTAAQTEAQAHQAVVHANASAQLATLIRTINATTAAAVASSSSSSSSSNAQVLGQSSDAHITKVPKQLRPEDQQTAEVIVGDLILEGPVAPDGFAFPNLKRVRGDVRVVLYSTMPMLSSLTFNNIFPVLEIVEGDLVFEGSGSSHDNVTTLSADTLPRLQKVFGSLKLTNMMRLTSLEGAFGNLTEVGGLQLHDLRRLPTVGNGVFSNLTTVKHTLEIRDNRALRSMAGAFSSVATVGHLWISSNQDLRPLDARVFPALVDVGQYYTGAGLEITSNGRLNSMNGAFAALVSVYRLNVKGNADQHGYNVDQGNGMLPALECFWTAVGERMCSNSDHWCGQGTHWWQGPHRFGRESNTPYAVSSDNQC